MTTPELLPCSPERRKLVADLIDLAVDEIAPLQEKVLRRKLEQFAEEIVKTIGDKCAKS